MKKLRLLLIRIFLYSLVILIGVTLYHTYRLSSLQLRVPETAVQSVPVEVHQRAERYSRALDSLQQSDSAHLTPAQWLQQWLQPDIEAVMLDSSSAAVFRWQGRNPRLKPLLMLCGSQTGLAAWEALQWLYAEGFSHERSIYLAISFSEQPMESLAAWMLAQEAEYEYLLAEGGALLSQGFTGLELPLAVVGLAKSQATDTLPAGYHSSIARLFLQYVGPELRFRERLLVANPRLSRAWLSRTWEASPATRGWQLPPNEPLADTEAFGFRALQQTIRQVFAPAIVAPGLCREPALPPLFGQLASQTYYFSPGEGSASQHPEWYEQQIRFYRWLVTYSCR